MKFKVINQFINFFKLIAKSDHIEEIADLRNSLINILFKIGLFLGGVSYLFSIIEYFQNLQYLNIIIISIVYFGVLFAFYFDIFQVNIKKILGIAVFAIFGIYFSLLNGMLSTGLLWLTALPIIALIIFGIRWFYSTILFIIAYGVLTIILFNNNIVIWQKGFEYYNTYNWSSSLIDTIMLSSIIAVAIAVFIHRLAAALVDEKKIKNQLENELKEKNRLIRSLEDNIKESSHFRKELLLLNHRLDVAQNNGEVGLWDYDIETRMFWLSTKALNILGIHQTDNNVEASVYLNKIYQEDLDIVKELFSNKIQNDGTFDIKFRIKTSSKQYKWILSTGQKNEEANATEKIYGSIRDITQEIETQKALQKSELWFQSIFENVLDGIMILKDNRFVQVNQQLADMFEGTQEDILNKFPWELSPEYQPDGNLSKTKAKYQLNKLFADGDLTFEWVHTKITNIDFYVEVNLRKFEYNNEVYAIAIMRDISDKKKYINEINLLNTVLETRVKERTQQLNVTLEELKYENEERKRTQEELYKLQDELIFSLSKARELSNLKSKFIAMASHEYRTPLTAIMSASHIIEVMTDKNNQQDIVKNINIIKSSVESMKNLLDEIFEIENTDELKYNPNITQVELNSYISSIINQTKEGTIIGGNIDFISDTSSLVISTDAIALRSILGKVLNNAIEFTKHDDPKIVINLYSRLKSVEINIKDNGIGIPSNELENIFDMFYKASNSTSSGKGLGLTIVRNYINLLNGQISINSEINKGTTVNIIIPKEVTI